MTWVMQRKLEELQTARLSCSEADCLDHSGQIRRLERFKYYKS